MLKTEQQESSSYSLNTSTHSWIDVLPTNKLSVKCFPICKELRLKIS